jgi:hypothetical protein
MLQPDCETLLDEARYMGVHVREKKLNNGLCGFYYAPMRTIVIDYGLAEAQLRCTLCHELTHAKYRDPGCKPVIDKPELRTRRETALRLVDPIEYASAENIFGSNSFLIANELDVTVQVIDDYKFWLRNNAYPWKK